MAQQLKNGCKCAVKGQNLSKTRQYDAIKSNVARKRCSERKNLVETVSKVFTL